MDLRILVIDSPHQQCLTHFQTPRFRPLTKSTPFPAPPSLHPSFGIPTQEILLKMKNASRYHEIWGNAAVVFITRLGEV